MKLYVERCLKFSPKIDYRNGPPGHKAVSVKQLLDQKSITEIEHPSHPSDFVLNDFWLFPKIKSASKGRKFQVTETVQK
jgi:hypothetical protein